MGQKILITGSRLASAAMLAKAREVVRWAQSINAVIIVGDADGIDAEVRKACHELGVLCFVYGAYNKIRGPAYPGEQPTTISGNYLARDRVMAKVCERTVAIKNLQSKTDGTGATTRYVEALHKRVDKRTYDGEILVHTDQDRSPVTHQ